MKGWVVRELGAPGEMAFEDIDEGEAPPDRIRVRAEAAAINFGDILQVAGKYQVKPELPFVPGWEVAGIVIAAPPSSGYSSGDRVFGAADNTGLTRGAFAEIVDLPMMSAMRIPEGMPFDDAAAFTVIYQTAYFALHRRGNLQPGETVLVHGGAGGVGSACIQLGKAAGATVIATAGSDEKVELCRRLGADLAINYKTQDFADVVNQHTDRRGADVVFDPVGGDVFDRSTKCVAFEGRIVIIGFTSGNVPQIPANHVLVKNYSVVGLHWGLYLRRNPVPVMEATQALFELYRDGVIKPHISATYPLSQLPVAMDAVAAGATTGKVVVTRDN